MEKTIKAFELNELKTIEVDVEKGIFNVNGKPFGENATFFSISCDGAEGYTVRVQISADVKFLSHYSVNGKKIASHQ